ncbi:MAG: hypothetical protein ACK4YP_19890, partial [Myxococcota bacterium]
MKPGLPPALLGCATAFGIAALAALALPWGDPTLAPATCWPDCYCEAVRAGPPLQPVGAWSSLAGLVVGLPIAAASARSGRGSFAADPVYGVALGAAAAAIAVFSGFYHATLVRGAPARRHGHGGDARPAGRGGESTLARRRPGPPR